MVRVQRVIVWSVIAASLGIAARSSHAWEKPRGLGLGAGATSYFPVGEWNRHPYAGSTAPSDLDYLGPGGGAAVEILGRIWPVSFLLRLELGGLSAAAWERWAARHGAGVDVEVLLFALHGGFGLVLGHLGRTRLETDVLLGVLVASGTEEDHAYGIEYPLPFLRPAFSFRHRLLLAVAVSRSAELVLGFETALSTPPWSAREGGHGPTVILSVSCGARFWPALRRRR